MFGAYISTGSDAMSIWICKTVKMTDAFLLVIIQTKKNLLRSPTQFVGGTIWSGDL